MSIQQKFNDMYNEYKIPLWLVTISLLIILSISNVNGYLCHQESANITNQTGIDGNCGLDYNGNYDYTYNGSSNLQNTLLITYNKPINATNGIWHTKIMNNTYLDFNIPSDCWNYNNNSVTFSIYTVHHFYGYIGNTITLKCQNQSYTKPYPDLGHELFTSSVQVNVSCGYYNSGWSGTIIDGNWSTGDTGFDVDVGPIDRGVWSGVSQPYGCGSEYSFAYEEAIDWNIDCNELWIQNNTACNGVNYTIEYFDYYNCGTTFNLPINNGSIQPCSFYYNISDCAENLCINPIQYNTTCCVVTPVVYCNQYTYELYGLNGTLIKSGLMSPYINNTYFYIFNEDVGTYYTKICDDSTRQLIVEGDNMIGLTGQTWLIITLILVFILFMWLSFKFDPLFMLLDGVIFVYFAFYSWTLYQSWFVTVLIGMIGLLFIIVGVMAKIGLSTNSD